MARLTPAPIRAELAESEVELPQKEPLPPVKLKVLFRRTRAEWAQWFDAVKNFINDWLSGYRELVASTAADYVVPQEVTVVLVDASAGPVQVTLPDPGDAAALGARRLVTVKKVDSSANAVTVVATGAGNIDGAVTDSLATQYLAHRYAADGTQWWTL